MTAFRDGKLILIDEAKEETFEISLSSDSSISLPYGDEEDKMIMYLTRVEASPD